MTPNRISDPDPPRRRRRLYSVESFGPKVLSILMHGAKGQQEFTAPWNKVIRLRQRVYQLREAMRRERHPIYPLVSRVQITIPEWPDPRFGPKPSDTIVRCILGPTDHQYDDIIQQLGIETGLGEGGDFVTPSETEPSAQDSIESLLSQSPSRRQK